MAQCLGLVLSAPCYLMLADWLLKVGDQREAYFKFLVGTTVCPGTKSGAAALKPGGGGAGTGDTPGTGLNLCDTTMER